MCRGVEGAARPLSRAGLRASRRQDSKYDLSATHLLVSCPTACLLRAGGGAVNVQGETQKGMDVVANDLFVSALTGHVAAMASEEEETAIAGAANRKYEIAFDPLDGSSNLDTNLPTGSIFCVFEHTPGSRVKAPPWQCLSSASYASSGCAWWLWSVRNSQSEARPLGAQPLPRLLEPTASTADGFTAFDDPGQATPSKAAAARRSSPPATRSTGKLLVSSPSSRNCAAGETWRVVPFFLVNTYPSTAHLPLYSAPTPLQRVY